MDHLSSCYFCGNALDEPLGTYRVPGAATGQASKSGPTVTLCPACRQKLDTVLENAGHEETRTAPANETDLSSHPGSEPTDSDGRLDSTEREEDSPAEPDDPVSSETAADDILVDPEMEESVGDETAEATGTDDDEGLPDELEAEMDPDIPDELETPESSDPSMDEDTEETPSSQGGRNESRTATDSKETPKAGGQNDDPLESSPDSSEVDGNAGDASAERSTATEESGNEQTPGEGTEAGGGTESDGDDATPRTTISALEYNKVMRLLQNREFPVERDEIETVAANAYDLRPSDCAQVIDLAVDRGLLREEENQLYRPNDGGG